MDILSTAWIYRNEYVDMEMTPLRLFEETELQERKITPDKFIPPLVEILNNTLPNPTNEQPVSVSRSVSQSLDELFPEQQYDEKNLQKAKEILGGLADQYSTEQLRDVVSEVQYLTESWLDDFERQIFGGLTLQEMLHERGGK